MDLREFHIWAQGYMAGLGSRQGSEEDLLVILKKLEEEVKKLPPPGLPISLPIGPNLPAVPWVGPARVMPCDNPAAPPFKVTCDQPYIVGPFGVDAPH
jgi:hypothetical protein